MQSVGINLKLLEIFTLLFSDIKKNHGITQLNLNNVQAEVKDLQLHILLADDDPDDIEIFQEALMEVAPHIKISSVNDGETLMLFLKKQKPNLLFLDLNMPCKNGLECLDEIRAVKSYNYLPVIIYSTTVNAAQVDASYLKGASLYLQKPSHFDGIKKSIARILSNSIAVLLEQPVKSKFVFKL